MKLQITSKLFLCILAIPLMPFAQSVTFDINPSNVIVPKLWWDKSSPKSEISSNYNVAMFLRPLGSKCDLILQFKSLNSNYTIEGKTGGFFIALPDGLGPDTEQVKFHFLNAQGSIVDGYSVPWLKDVLIEILKKLSPWHIGDIAEAAAKLLGVCEFEEFDIKGTIFDAPSGYTEISKTWSDIYSKDKWGFISGNIFQITIPLQTDINTAKSLIDKSGVGVFLCIKPSCVTSDVCIMIDNMTFSPKNYVLFLLDVSGSMGQKLKNDPNQTRIDAAKTALVEVVDELAKDQNTEFGVLAFGTEGCNTEFITKFTHNAEIVRQTIAPLKPRGATPIEKAIREGANILRNRTNAGRLVLILISDGQETCGGDPVKAAAECCGGGRQPDYEEKKIVDILQFIKLAYADNRNKFIEFAVIAFDADSISRGQLRKIAEAGNGKFVEASNVEELIGAITGTVRSSFVSHGDNSIWYLILMIIFAGIVVVGIKAIKMKSFLSSPNKFWGIITIKNNLGSSSLKLYKRKIIIGRASDCDIVIDDPYISKKHAQIQFKDGVAYIIDLGSKNGTFVDNRRISSQPLSSGATIKIGETKIKFQFKQN
ncbi:MAG: FHA domain-containing protein [Candidatus Helarchaeota archaeon]